MCKVLMIAGIKKQHQEKVQKILEVASKPMSTLDNDGIGYAAITSKGKIYGEKWLNNGDAFKIHAQPKATKSQMFLDDMLGEAGKWKNRPSEDKVYDRFGKISKESIEDTVAILMHARNSTVGMKKIENTHPFVIIDDKTQEDTALIHNGTINNHMSLTKVTSTCDSEVILHEYVKNMMNYNPWGIAELSKTLSGQYAVGVLTSANIDGDIIPVLDVFKYNKDLYVAYCEEIETAIFATTSGILESIGRETGFQMNTIVELKDEFLLRIDAVTGLRLENLIEFNGKRTSNYYPEANGWGGTGYGSSNNSDNVVEISSTKAGETEVEETIELTKQNFESAHSELFTSTYHQPKSGLSKPEQEFMDKLAAADNTNLAALKLVQKVLGVKISS